MEHIHNTLPVPCEKSKIVSLDASIMKSIVVLLIIFDLLYFVYLDFL